MYLFSNLNIPAEGLSAALIAMDVLSECARENSSKSAVSVRPHCRKRYIWALIYVLSAFSSSSTNICKQKRKQAPAPISLPTAPHNIFRDCIYNPLQRHLPRTGLSAGNESSFHIPKHTQQHNTTFPSRSRFSAPESQLRPVSSGPAARDRTSTSTSTSTSDPAPAGLSALGTSDSRLAFE
ncbi:hypothetical protein I7I51_02944 [Histoplasma capsulatum]|uniref:Uncharacterized protein n=1 Tax=Ajellomyces capsulatus TaxID=5037 RepID=A0A8A1MLN4_AJECA|nr:hypothetical protein I7I51_02944 [Histoplasma capsulatum]